MNLTKFQRVGAAQAKLPVRTAKSFVVKAVSGYRDKVIGAHNPVALNARALHNKVQHHVSTRVETFVIRIDYH
jgi:hypothetical protein